MSFGMVAAGYLGIIDVPTPVLSVAFDEGSGNTFSPTIGPGIGTVTPGYGQWIAGVHGGTALGRNTSGPAISDSPCAVLAGVSSLGTAAWSGMTVMAWVNLHGDETAERWPLLLLDGMTSDDGWMGWQVPYNSDKPRSWVDGLSVQSIGDVAPANTWVHFCTTWDGANQYFYVDGTLVASAPVTGPLHATSNIAIGSVAWNYGAQGVDDLRIYDVTLAQTQITTLLAVAA